MAAGRERLEGMALHHMRLGVIDDDIARHRERLGERGGNRDAERRATGHLPRVTARRGAGDGSGQREIGGRGDGLDQFTANPARGAGNDDAQHGALHMMRCQRPAAAMGMTLCSVVEAPSKKRFTLRAA